MSGFIYAIECAGYIKIGYSTNPKRRFSKIQSDNPIPCKMLGYWKGILTDESELHEVFKADHEQGDWFKGSLALRGFIDAVRITNTNRSPRLVNFCGVSVPRGTEATIAKALGINKASVCKWNATGIPVARARDVAKITGIPLHELRPDVWSAA